MGLVLQARHTEMDRTVAIKLLKPALLPQKEQIDRFMREARTISRLKHENIVHVYSVGTTDCGQPYIAMEYVEGRRLSDLIAERGFMHPAEALPIFIQVCDALAHAHHHKIVHRDIKPSNIMIVEDGGKMTVKVFDFGIAKSLADNMPSHTQTGMLVGSVFYMSPGQCAGRAGDLRSDIYSLGCTLFEALTGKPPFRGETFFETLGMQLSEPAPAVNDVNPAVNISSNLQAVLDCMLQKDAINRYQTMEQLKADFERILAGDEPAAIPKPRRSQQSYLKKRRKTNRLRLGLLVALFGSITVSSIAYLMWQKSQVPVATVTSFTWRVRGFTHEKNNDVAGALKLYEQAIAAAQEEGNVDAVDEIRHRAGWMQVKQWDGLGRKRSEIAIARTGTSSIETACKSLEQRVLPLVNHPDGFSGLQARNRLSMLLIAYYDGMIAARMMDERDQVVSFGQRLIDLFSRTMDYANHRDEKAAKYVQALQAVIPIDSDTGEKGKLHENISLFRAAIKQGFVDPVIGAERLSEYENLLKRR